MHNLAIIIPLLVLLVLFFIYSPKLKLHLNFRRAHPYESTQLRDLGLLSYSEYKSVLAPEHWETLKTNLLADETWDTLLEKSTPFICETNNTIIGMAFLIPSGNPTRIYPPECCYIRMVAVHPDYTGKGIARRLTEMCIAEARIREKKLLSSIHLSL